MTYLKAAGEIFAATAVAAGFSGGAGGGNGAGRDGVDPVVDATAGTDAENDDEFKASTAPEPLLESSHTGEGGVSGDTKG
jgi:hypothetical protein